MSYGKANILDQETLEKIVESVSRDPQFGKRNKVMFMLSFHAGLRACEIAGLTWSNMTDAKGEIRKGSFWVPKGIAKNGREREVPLHPDLYEALVVAHAGRKGEPIAFMQTNKQRHMSANYVAVWFKKVYKDHDLEGCSSHSGRRTMITALARNCNKLGCSLKDVQNIAGHAYIDTTEEYIEASENVSGLVASLYGGAA